MKKRISLLLCISFFTVSGTFAQDTVKVSVLGKNMVTVVEGNDRTDVKIGNSTIDISDEFRDTVKIRVGRKAVVITERGNGASVDFDRLDDNEFETWTGKKPKFKGHWPVLEMGINSFADVSYDGYATPNFMDLNHGKSLEVNINFLRYSIGFQKEKRNIGMVTGLGLNMNDYRFSNQYTIENNNGYILPVALPAGVDAKTKLSTTYLTVPILFEFQIPVNDSDKKIFFSAGLIGGLKLGSHTKVKYTGYKEKDRDDFNIAPFRYGATARVGYKGINLYATYYLTDMFKEGRGPVMTPFSIGIGLLNW
jgi:hypothetical protein